MKREIRNLLAAAAVAVVTVTGAVVTVAQAGDDGTRKITGTNDAAPGLGWSVDAAAMHGQAFAEFRDPRTGSDPTGEVPVSLPLMTSSSVSWASRTAA